MSTCKGPGAGPCLPCWRNSWSQVRRGREGGGEGRWFRALCTMGELGLLPRSRWEPGGLWTEEGLGFCSGVYRRPLVTAAGRTDWEQKRLLLQGRGCGWLLGTSLGSGPEGQLPGALKDVKTWKMRWGSSLEMASRCPWHMVKLRVPGGVWTGQILDLCIRAGTEACGGGRTVSDAELRTPPGSVDFWGVNCSGKQRNQQ